MITLFVKEYFLNDLLDKNLDTFAKMSEYPAELNAAIQLQTIVNSLNEENATSSLETIMSSIYVQEENIPDLCREIVRMVPIRSKNIKLYANFLTELAKKMQNQEEFEATLLDIIVDEDVPQLTYQLLKNDIFDIRDVNKKSLTCKTYYFFDEFNDGSVLYDLDVFKDKLKNEAWKAPLEELRDNLWLADSLALAIKNDNVDAAQKILIASGDQIDWDQKIKWSEFEVCEAPPSTSILGLAAFWASSKVWLFAITNGAKIDADVAKCSVMGGNLDIIRECAEFIDNCNEYAFIYHHHDVFDWLLQRGETCNLTPIDAMMAHDYKFLVDLVKKGTDINTLSISESGISPLIFATQHSLRNVIKYLVNSGATVDQADRTGLTPLHIAIKSDDVKTAEALIQCGANVNAKDSKGATPLMQACIIGSMRCVKLLLSNGADPKIADNKGNTPAKRTFNIDIQKLLAESSA